MNQRMITDFYNENRKYLFPNRKYSEEEIIRQLSSAPPSFFQMTNRIRFSSPLCSRIVAAVLGPIGVDRFLLGDVALGILKLFTVGGCYVLWIADAITAPKRCCTRNCEALFDAINRARLLESTPYVAPQPIPRPAPQPIPRPAPQPIPRPAPQPTPQPAPQPAPHSYVSHETVFLSYSHKDKDRLLPLFTALKNSGLSVWYDEGIRAGAEWEEEIVEHLAKSTGFLFFVSENSLRSQNCRDELYQARKRDKRFINILVDDVDFSKKEFEWFDFRYSRYQQIPAYGLPLNEILEKIHNGLR